MPRTAGQIPCLLRALPWFLALLTGCAATSGQGARQGSFWPTWHRVGVAAVEAARSPATWAPLLGAGVLRIGDADEEISEWARDETPLFGANEAADTASDVLRWTAAGAYAATVIAGRRGGTGASRPSPARKLGVGAMAEAMNIGATQGLKELTERERPDASNDRSFPSQHTSDAALFATLGVREIEALAPPASRRELLRWIFGGLAAGTAWARVEGGEHFPSDVLVGAALGHFVAALFYSAFLDAHEGRAVMPEVTVSRQAWRVGFRAAF
ncbi:MAG: phosphatase PAP2 family protein [Gammaproteobacteria bacterium]|nr:phosphatase PAP2 family protein [Gammaproteobacteria bacterium]NIR84540.1 phosphatase PAP2 family protein [Gammaproteobacteria bacterium]NIR90443.1 phosphatase PAP2 family protein [Gammaproteobacteria bacterium]NIU05591.1 phosphatase PAP2 family protein [Gammaproteobacteria bacterium]NIV52730.1 phosphatase PAP2 family protein [Gammaproteobacteria bacterium]